MRAGAMLPTQLCWLTQSFRVLCLLLGLCANSALGDECGCDNREALHTLRQATLVEGRVTQAKLIEGAARSIKFVLEPWREAKVEGRRPMTLIATLPERCRLTIQPGAYLALYKLNGQKKVSKCSRSNNALLRYERAHQVLDFVDAAEHSRKRAFDWLDAFLSDVRREPEVVTFLAYATQASDALSIDAWTDDRIVVGGIAVSFEAQKFRSISFSESDSEERRADG